MIKQYKQNSVIETFGDCGLIYEAKKGSNKYFMYQFEQYGEAEKYNFKVIKKLVSSHILGIVDEFQQNQTTYVITAYAETDLLKLQMSQPNRVFPLPVALDYFTKLIVAIEQVHDSKLVYRNIKPQAIKVHDNDLFFSDFMLSQFCKRKQRLFDTVGLIHYLAPQYFGDDGYGHEVDIWAAGVLFYYMLIGEYPFNFPNKSQEACMVQFRKHCQQKFNFTAEIQKCKNPGYVKSNTLLDDFFRKIFIIDYTKRITIKQIKAHKLFEGYFEEDSKYDPDMLEVIEEQQGFSSLLMTQFLDLRKFKASRDIEKEQLILDFIEKCSETIMLEGAEFIPEDIRLKTQFALLKVALIRVMNLLDFFYGKKKADFQVSEEQWEKIKYSTAFRKVCQTVEKRQKIIRMLFKSARAQIPIADNWFNQQIPDEFNQIKIPYRNTTAAMFQLSKNIMAEHKNNKKITRKMIEIFARIVILHLINRIFDESDFQTNFALYISWNKGKKTLENLDIWINSQKKQILKQFIKTSTTRYL